MPTEQHVPSFENHEIHHGKRIDSTPVVSRSPEHHEGGNMFWLVFTLIFRENTLGVVKASHLSSLSTNLTRGLAARRLLRIPHKPAPKP
ncbi:hypothetical protein TNCV_3904361 [Trichonephila clavipes]|nr:hypothetical protein TNCV_3904361 [Trichonephila clavipes]